MMNPVFNEHGVSIWHGDALAVLREMPDESVNCCVTSPPYWGLRDYGTGTWEGGDPECGHTNLHGVQGASGQRADRTFTGSQNYYRDMCRKCGAVRVDQQLGLEKTPEEYVGRVVEILSEVRRVLRNNGTLWMNMGDGYANDGKWGGTTGGKHVAGLHGTAVGRSKRSTGLKPKDLIGMPWRLAFALQEAGWYLRQDIIWSKPNPMPESVSDRCTKAHEYLFLLSKSPRYYFDQDAIAEDVTGNAHARGDGVNKKIKMPDGWDTGTGGHGSFHREGREKGKTRPRQNPSFSAAVNELVDKRNKRSVWTVPTEPCPEAHFATFPTELIKPCILAGCPAGGVVLDPFGGSGTTGDVARALHCQAWLIELNPEYIEIAKRRLAQPVLQFTEPAEPEPASATQTTIDDVYGNITV